MKKHLLCVAFLLFAVVGTEAKSRTVDRIPASSRGPMAALKAKGLSTNLLGSLLDSRGRKLNPARYRTYGAQYYLLPRTAKASAKAKWAAIAAENRAYRNTIAKAKKPSVAIAKRVTRKLGATSKKAARHSANKNRRPQPAKIAKVPPAVVKVELNWQVPPSPINLKVGEKREIFYRGITNEDRISYDVFAQSKNSNLVQILPTEPPKPGMYLIAAMPPPPDAPNETDIEVIAIANPSIKETLHVIVERPPAPTQTFWQRNSKGILEYGALAFITALIGLIILLAIRNNRRANRTTASTKIT